MTRRSRVLAKPRRPVAALAVALALASASPSAAVAADSAVAVMYHRFGESRHPSTNVRIEQFEAHLREIVAGDYTVLPLGDIVDALQAGRPLPERAIAITIDDAYLSVYREAWPRLKAAGLPFTLFVATDPVDRGLQGYMNWRQIRELAEAGVTIGSQTASHPHMADLDRDRNRREIAESNARFVAELGRAPELFAYPFGEVSAEVEAVVREAGFRAAFGQHSGVMWPGASMLYLPRFAMNEAYGDVGRFRLAANALALPVSEVTPADPLIGGDNPPAFGFTVDADAGPLDRLRCYASHEAGALPAERLGGTRIEVRMSKPMPPGRTRINCTLPGPDGRWRWFGRQFYVAP